MGLAGGTPKLSTGTATAPGLEITNHEQLVGHGAIDARALALRLARTGLIACDPARAVERLVRWEPPVLTVDGVSYPLGEGRRVVVLGAGKASLAVVTALERELGDRLNGGTVVVRDRVEPLPRTVEVLEASHPLPDARSVTAARALLATANGLGAGDLVLACFTGGSSALSSLPPAGVSTDEKRRLHELLLEAGLPIADINTVRKQVSDFKGGRLARAAFPATVVNLTVSDVAGDPLDAITDPTVQNLSTAADAIEVLRAYGLWEQVPGPVRSHLEQAERACPDLGDVEIQSVLLVTGEAACEAMGLEAARAGASPITLSTGLECEATALGRVLGQIAAESATLGRPFAAPSVILGCGGESTVTLGPGDQFGAGGPNREAVLAAAERVAGTEVACVFLDTDGSDGGGAAAGGIADGETVARAAAAGVDLRRALSAHRSEEALDRLGDAVETGPTNTNVNDLFVITIGRFA